MRLYHPHITITVSSRRAPIDRKEGFPLKLLTVTVPCYNSAAYMERAIDSLLVGGDEMDVIIIDDGSKDDTAAIADRYAAQYPEIIRVIHQPNGGHGSGINQGLRHAEGVYFKVVDSDDKLNEDALRGLLTRLRDLTDADKQVDLIIHDYVYDRVDDVGETFSVSYSSVIKADTPTTWSEARQFPIYKQFMIHSLIYRTAMLRDEMKLELPEHTFYEDNIYIYRPLPYAKRLYYYHAPLYRYRIGREDQSINEKNLIKRMDQVVNIAKQMITSYTLAELEQQPRHLRKYMLSNAAGQLFTTCALLFIANTPESLQANKELWQTIYDHDPRLYHALRRTPTGMTTILPGRLGRAFLVFLYRTGQKMISF